MKIFAIFYYLLQMPHAMWEVSKYDLNDLRTDHLSLHKMEWEDIFMLLDMNDAFYKMIYRMRKRNITLTAEMNEYWKITDRFPYLENVTILDDFPITFRNEMKRLKRIKRMRIVNSSSMVDYITSEELIEVEMSSSDQENELLTIDFLVRILRINKDIRRLDYARGFLSNESIYYLMRNKIECLKLANVFLNHSNTFHEYFTRNTYLRKLTVLGTNSVHMQRIIFSKRMIEMHHIKRLTIHVLETRKINYASIRKFKGLRCISLYFSYGPHAESNILTILNILRDATFLLRIKIWRITNRHQSNDWDDAQSIHSEFHDEINSYADIFESQGVEMLTCTRFF